MIEPDDFGLDWVQTLAHVSEACRCRLHGAFWQQWHKSIEDHEPKLELISPDDDPSDPTATHTYAGVGSCRIGCRIQLPEGKVRAVLMLLHGYDDPPKLAADARSEAEALPHYERVRDEIRAFIETLPNLLRSNTP